MNPVIFKYLITSLFVIATFWLSYKGMKKTKDIKSFSVGNGDMSPYLIGITMAASVASTATFVINPGFVYIHGFSAYLHYAVAGGLGILVAFITLTKGVRKLGKEWSFNNS
jgi:sodium/pantothenate symporter